MSTIDKNKPQEETIFKIDSERCELLRGASCVKNAEDSEGGAAMLAAAGTHASALAAPCHLI